ncbi:MULTISPECIES: ArnT family glycosyltransferase [Marinobacter]|jgi:4-amino-4-deoxy-L-arabinose transferase-like glycosyltransferase|uniref:ArnT family glycosyltransferase n=1 Tax=Marinobacter TaxID=2742 RepID=UPI000EABE6AD|nr:glycosyltransferase family 39 protein [Marinobacter nauticus]MCA0914580.1 glycosyltransferase family 39 protein [Marinobacter nauticus]RKR72370.1 4-amino-4-deoxy-L-arabinose transferase-like glycosyltransferase [Marinobacter nauticus]
MTLDFRLRRLPDTLFNLPYNRLLLVVLAFAALMILTGIGLRSPWPADEPRFAEVAREMVTSGQWLLPMRGGELYPDKPPVFMWAIAFFYWLTGNLKIAFLLPNALCSLLTLGLVFDLGTRLWNQRTGAIAALLLMVAPQFLIQAQRAQIDAMVACWIMVACYGLIRHFFVQPSWRWYFVAWAFMGLGIITKGVGFLPALLFIPILALKLQDTSRFQGTLRWRCALGPLVMLAVVAAWLVPMVLAVSHLGTDEALAYRDNILFKQTGERYADSWGHIQPWYYYLASVIPSLWFPLPLLFLALLRPIREILKHRLDVVVLLAWVVLVVAFFSLSPGKRGVYVLPALPALALSLAPALSGQNPARWFGAVTSVLHLLLGAALIILGVLAWNDHPRLVEKVADYTQDPARLHEAGTLLFTLGFIWVASLMAFWRCRALGRWFIALMVSWLVFTTWGYRILEPLRTPRNVLAAAEQFVPAGGQIGMINFREQFILFSKRDFTHFSYFSDTEQESRNAWLWMRETPDSYLMVAEDGELGCFNKQGARPLGTAHRDTYVLLSDQDMTDSCEPPDKVTRFTTDNPGEWLD